MIFRLEFAFGPEAASPEVRVLSASPEGESSSGGGDLRDEAGVLYLAPGRQRLERVDVPGAQLILLGDPVIGDRERLETTLLSDSRRLREHVLYEEIRGHYYWFIIFMDELMAGGSFCGLFPLYYHLSHDRIVLGSRSSAVAQAAGCRDRDRRNLLERVLFNYPLLGSTWWRDVHRLPAHRYLTITSAGAQIGGDFELCDYFGTPSPPTASTLRQLADVFEKEALLFLPDVHFGISFTGGFDGRTLVAAAHKAGRSFTAYSFGRPGSVDTTLPRAHADKLGIPYLPIYLDQDYVEKESVPSAMSFMQETDYEGNLGRAHYQFAARQLSGRVDQIVTGNFGSELFRALHHPGVMMSEHLIRLFASEDASWKDELRTAAHSFLPGLFEDESESLIADLEGYLLDRKDWDPTHRFYDFVMLELFRKYFGPELVMQSQYLSNRTPFLSLRFVEALNRTHWAGIHSRLFEKRKARRMKGQVFYSAYIRSAWPALYRMRTGKGYAPADVLEVKRLPLLVAGVVFARWIRARDRDPHNLEGFFRRHQSWLSSAFRTPGDEISERLIRGVPGESVDDLLRGYSLAGGWQMALRRMVS